MDHVKIMINEPKRAVVLEIDMTPDGQFAGPQAGMSDGPVPVTSRILRAAIVIGVLSIIAVLVALTLWVALALIPIAIGMGLVAYLALRFQLWRRGGPAKFRSGRGSNLWR